MRWYRRDRKILVKRSGCLVAEQTVPRKVRLCLVLIPGRERALDTNLYGRVCQLWSMMSGPRSWWLGPSSYPSGPRSISRCGSSSAIGPRGSISIPVGTIDIDRRSDDRLQSGFLFRKSSFDVSPLKIRQTRPKQSLITLDIVATRADKSDLAIHHSPLGDRQFVSAAHPCQLFSETVSLALRCVKEVDRSIRNRVSKNLDCCDQ